MRITGLHHVTLISGDLERTTTFYRDVLGLALWREGANDDDPGRAALLVRRRHRRRARAALISFLEYPQMEAGHPGDGRAPTTSRSRSARAAEVAAWRDWLRSRDVPTTEVFERGGLASVYLRDPDGHILEICAAA